MGKYTLINKDALNDIQLDCGVLLKTFDVSSPAVTTSNIICTTKGGITATCTPTFEDFGSDIDNCPNNSKELKRITGYECTLTFATSEASADVVKLALGAVDVSGNKVSPRSEIKSSDFANIWWVSDKVGGGAVAIKLADALGTGGFSMKTTKKAKGEVSITLTGHASIDSIATVPMEIYFLAPETSSSGGSSSSNSG